MKSTARILNITEKFGGDEKQKLYQELKELRREVKAELLYHVRYGINKAERAYYQEIKPGHKNNNKPSRTLNSVLGPFGDNC